MELGQEREDLYLPRPTKVKKFPAPPPIPAPGPMDGRVVPFTPGEDGGEVDCNDTLIAVVKRVSSKK